MYNFVVPLKYFHSVNSEVENTVSKHIIVRIWIFSHISQFTHSANEIQMSNIITINNNYYRS